MAKLDPNRNITRANHLRADGSPAASGYMVRFARRGKKYQQYFGDVAFGGQRKALAAARADRDKMEQQFRPYTPLELAKRRNARNSSGTAGVRWTERTITKNNKTYTFEFATAAWTVAGVRHTRAFSVNKYGEEKAWALAIKARQAGLRDATKAAAS